MGQSSCALRIMCMVSIRAKMLEADHNDFKPNIGSDDPLDRTMVVLNDVVQVLDSSKFDVDTAVELNALDGRRVSAAVVDRDLVGQAIEIDGALEEATCGCDIALGREQEVDGLTYAVDSSIQVLPVSAHKDVGLGCKFRPCANSSRPGAYAFATPRPVLARS